MRQDISLPALIEVTKKAEHFFGRELTGMVYKTGGIQPIPISNNQ